jgi:type VI secretion system protein ImpG
VLSEHALRYGTRTGYIGSEVFVSLVDEQHAPWQENLRYISAEVLCTSRDLPLMLQQELGQFIMADSMPVKSLTLRKGRRHRVRRWRKGSAPGGSSASCR